MKVYVLGAMNGLDSWKMVERETPFHLITAMR